MYRITCDGITLYEPDNPVLQLISGTLKTGQNIAGTLTFVLAPTHPYLSRIKARSSVSWTPPVSLANQIPSATAGSGTIYCDTYSGSTLLGTKSVSITLTVPGSVVPSAGTLSAALSGASGAYGSSITSYTITGGGWTATNGALTTGTLASAGNITFTATVTDSRGRKASTTRTISVIDYTKPGVAVCDVYRCDADGNRKKVGTYFAVEINASYSAITGNTLNITA